MQTRGDNPRFLLKTHQLGCIAPAGRWPLALGHRQSLGLGHLSGRHDLEVTSLQSPDALLEIEAMANWSVSYSSHEQNQKSRNQSCEDPQGGARRHPRVSLRQRR